MPQNAELFCDSCQFGREHKFPFRNHKIRDTDKLIHTDVGGSMQNKLIGVSRFYIAFKDDTACFTYIYFMTHMSDVFKRSSNITL